MPKPLRYTGDWPPPEVLRDYPNWEMAYDEEGEEGQDETTLKPEGEQTFISENTVHTAGDVFLADGRTFPAIITLPYGAPPESCSFHDGTRWWIIDKRKKGWTPNVTFTRAGDQLPPPDLTDVKTFPLRIKTRLPKAQGEMPWQIEIQTDGTEKEWA